MSRRQLRHLLLHGSFATGLVVALSLGGTLRAVRAQVVFEGLLTDPSGVPLPDVDLDFFDAQTGIKVDPSAPGWEGQEDKTDAFGFYEMVVKPDIYDVRFEPPESRIDLAAVFHRDLIVASDLRRDVQLPAGSRVSGRVLAPDGSPVPGVDLDLKDPGTGERLATVRDDTAADGTFGVTVIPGVWDVVFKPPAGLGVGPLEIPSFDLTVDAALDVTLPLGYLVSGRIESPDGRGVFFADLDVQDVVTRRRIPTPDDESDADGRFVLNVPPGRYHVYVSPPRGLPLAPTARYDIEVEGDLTLDPIALASGVVISGSVRDPGGAAVPGADLDLFRVGTCLPYPVANGSTDASGQFSLRVENGSYDVQVNPAPATSLPSRRFEEIDTNAAATFELRFPGTAPQMTDLAARVVDGSGAGVEGVVVRGEPIGAGQAFSGVTREDGSLSERVALGTYRVFFEPPIETGFGESRIEAVSVPCGFPSAHSLRPRSEPPPPRPASLVALSNHPNPWRSGTRVTLTLPGALARSALEVYDIRGARIRTLHLGPLPGGVTELDWDGRNEGGGAVATGVYFLSFRTETERVVAKIARIIK